MLPPFFENIPLILAPSYFSIIFCLNAAAEALAAPAFSEITAPATREPSLIEFKEVFAVAAATPAPSDTFVLIYCALSFMSRGGFGFF